MNDSIQATVELVDDKYILKFICDEIEYTRYFQNENILYDYCGLFNVKILENSYKEEDGYL